MGCTRMSAVPAAVLAAARPSGRTQPALPSTVYHQSPRGHVLEAVRQSRPMTQVTSFLRVLDASLSGLIAHEPIELVAEWSTKTRRVYRSDTQQGGGAGPFVEVEDRMWQGTLHCPGDSGAILFLLTADSVRWVKAAMIAPTLPVEVSLHAYLGFARERSTFTGRMAGAVLPGVPVATPANLSDVCAHAPRTLQTGRVLVLAQTEDAAFAAVVFPKAALKMGRNHVWRLRDDMASVLDPGIREVLTRRRSGTIEVREEPR